MDITHFIPDAYATYRKAVGDAFAFFVNRVPHLKPLAGSAERGAKPATVADVLAIAHASPTLHKLAQVLARNRHLAPELRGALQTLESHEPRTPMPEVLTVVRDELRESAVREIEIAPEALAEASVAVVVPFEAKGGGRGVLKILKPGVRVRLDTELAVWSKLGDYFNERCHAYGLPDVDYRETFDTVADLLRNEIDFAGEQSHLAEASRALRGVRGVLVPGLLPYCTSRITALGRIDGQKVTSIGAYRAVRGGTLAARLVDALVAQPLFSTAPSAIFHADPHAGNLMLSENGEIGILDWALVGRLSIADREHLAHMVLGAVMFDSTRICRAIEDLSRHQSREAAGLDFAVLRRVVDACLADLRRTMFPSVAWLCRLLDEVTMRARVRFSRDLLLFRKTLLMLEGVVADLGGDLDAAMRGATVEQVMHEWPLRAVVPPYLRTFGIRVSTLELAAAGWAFPAAMAARLLRGGHYGRPDLLAR